MKQLLFASGAVSLVAIYTGLTYAQIGTGQPGTAYAPQPNAQSNQLQINANGTQTPGNVLLGTGIGNSVPNNQKTTQFYNDKNAVVIRLGDRVLLGALQDNPATSNRNATPTDWLTTVMGASSIGAYATAGAQTGSLARYGTIGFLGGSRASDATNSTALLGYVPASIGVASWGINDDLTSPTTTHAWAYYGEAWRMPNVSYQPTFVQELESVSFGTLPTGTTTPYQTNIGGGVYGLQIGSGGGQTSVTIDSQAAMTVVNNPNKYEHGIVFGANALTGTNGTDTGYAEAIALGTNQAIEWHTSETVSGAPGVNSGGYIRSTVTTGADAMRIEFQNGGIVISNNSGQPILTISMAATATNSLSLQSGNGTQAAGIYVNEGTSGSPNLTLQLATGGEILVNNTAVTATGSTAAAIPAYGFLHFNVNGTDMRIPLFSPTQAGG